MNTYNYKFIYREDHEPICHSDAIDSNGIDFLSCLLTDNGGQILEETIKWLDEGIFRIKLVKSGILEIAEWPRDNWSAEIKKQNVKIYSLYDDSYHIIIHTSQFEKIIYEWREFIYKCKK